jgi:hypothetical protein
VAPRRRWSREPVVWIAGVAATVVSALILAAMAWVGPQVIDAAAAKDRVRKVAQGDADLRYTVTYLDGGYDLVLPPTAALTSAQISTLRNWSGGDGNSKLNKLTTELRAAGAADPNILTLRLTLEGRRAQPIRIDAIEAVDVRRQRPYTDTFLSIPPQGMNNTIRMMFNLDEIRPVARTASPVGPNEPPRPIERDDVRPGAPFFQSATLTINDREEDAIVLQSVVTRWATSFNVRIAYRVGDQSKTLLITNGGHPFAVTPLHCTDHTVLSQGRQLVEGHVSYRQIWQNRNDFTGADPVADPAHYAIGFPYC